MPNVNYCAMSLLQWPIEVASLYQMRRRTSLGFALMKRHTSVEILSHIGDLLEGSFYLVKGELVYLTSSPLPWGEEVSRFFSAAKALDSYLESDAPLACSVEKLIQGPIGDAMTHIGQIVMLRRVAGKPVRVERISLLK